MGIVVTAIAIDLWVTRTAAIPGMVYYPGGAFPFGRFKKPVNLGPFYMDELEVSNADFAAFCKATGCTPPNGNPALPVVNVTMTQARAFAQWKEKRLPNELEWERCSRGVDSMLYPWGNKHDPTLANVSDNPKLQQHALVPVSAYKAVPTRNMAGNAWELVDTPATPSEADLAHFATLMTPPPTAEEKWVQIRGGAFDSPLDDAITYKYRAIPERYSAPNIGFRCARDRKQL
jgi:formylglycine-generating enzyme required for sulfatase activity